MALPMRTMSPTLDLAGDAQVVDRLADQMPRDEGGDHLHLAVAEALLAFEVAAHEELDDAACAPRRRRERLDAVVPVDLSALRVVDRLTTSGTR